MRFNDPRRFGSLHFTTAPGAASPAQGAWARSPLGDDFTAEYLWEACRGRHVAIKQHLMNGRVVVGVGNIYANEALFRAAIHPSRAAGRIARARFEPLVRRIRDVLTKRSRTAERRLRNFVGGDGNPGYFSSSLKVYDRHGRPCERCGAPIRRQVMGSGPPTSARAASASGLCVPAMRRPECRRCGQLAA